MAFLIGGANTLRDTGYEITNSLRFGVDTDLKRLPSATGQSIKGTLSVWVKFATADTEMAIIGGFDNSGANDNDGYFVFKRLADGNLQFEGGDNVYLETTALFRDVSAWYHIVLAIDSGNATADQKQRIYVNGAEITAFDTRNNLTNLQDLPMNTTAGNDDALLIGCDEDTGGKGLFFNGYMSEFYWIDQNQYAASDFGEYNDDGIWIPKEFEGSFGVNGVFLQFKETGTDADASGMGADTGGSTLHFTATNLAATDVTTDTPTNNFMTGNPLAKKNGYFDNVTYSEGNLKLTSPSIDSNYTALGTFATKNMPFYYEIKLTDVNENNDTRVGVVNAETSGGSTIAEILYRGDGSVSSTGETTLTSQGNLSDGTILSVACDPDTNVKFYLNGSLTSTIAINSSYQDLEYTFFYRIVNAGNSEVNFGNPSYAISSGNSDANGYGNFEYAVPSGYYALCTKNLAEYG
jgi:hypothetical protein